MPSGTRESMVPREGDRRIMTTDLIYLASTAILTAALWIPYVVCQVMTNGFLQPPNYVDPSRAPSRSGASAPTAPT